MVAEEIAPNGSRLRWLWIVVGVLVGGVLLATLVPVVQDVPPRPDVAILVGALTFALMGVLVGYGSPGRTIAEAAAAGGLLAVITPIALRVGFDTALAPATTLLAAFAGVGLACVGGWVGEILQGTIDDGERERFQWIWVGVGSVLGVMLSVYSVFVLYALFNLSSGALLVSFLSSFFLTAFVVAYFSPGATVLEPATAAVLVIVFDALLALAGFRAPFPILAIVIAALLAFGVALVGGYFGEVAHNLRFGTAWGGVRWGVRAPLPGERRD